MGGLIILLIIGCAAIAVLLACLRGFSQAQRHEKVEAAFVRVEKRKERPPGRQNSSFTDFPERKPSLSREPATHQLCAGTAALVEMAIILGSRNFYTDIPAGSPDLKGSRLPHSGGRTRQDRMKDPQPPVQPPNNS